MGFHINTTCNATLDNMRITSEVPLVGSMTFHTVGIIICAACTLIAILCSFYLIWMHALHYTNPYQQRHIIRILFMVPVYAAASFLSFWFYWHAIYFQVISECYEAFAIASFFALLCHYIAPNLHDQKTYFRSIQPKGWVLPISWLKKCGGDRGPWRTPRSGLTWFNIIWTGVYQYCFIRVTMTVTAVLTQYWGHYCESSNSPVFAHIWILVIEGCAVSVAMYCLIQFYYQLRVDLAPHRPLLKVVAIKLVIFLSFWQSFLISILTSSTLKVVEPTAKIQYPDLKVGIPSLLLCIEMAIFSILHLFAFPYSPYERGIAPSKYPLSPTSNMAGNDGVGPKQGGFLGIKAIGDAMNPWDLIKGFGRGMKWLFHGRKHRENDSSYKNSSFNITPENENDMTLGEAGASDTGYKTGTAYNGGMPLPIANEFRKSNFGLPGKSPHDEEGAGLIAHAQPNPLNPGSSNYVPARQRYDANGQDITGPIRYDPASGSRDHSPYQNQAAPPYPLGGPSTVQRNDSPYRQSPERLNQSVDIGMAVSGEPEQYHSHVGIPSSSQAYLENKRAARQQPSEQWKNSTRPTTPPEGGDELFFGGAAPGKPDRNMI